MTNSAIQITLNIGLSVNGDKPDAGLVAQRAVFALDAIRRRCPTLEYVAEFAIADSNTEPTLVVSLKTAWSMPFLGSVKVWVAKLSAHLRQDAIACYVTGDGRGVGFLAGPKADVWGPFNPDYFFVCLSSPEFTKRTLARRLTADLVGCNRTTEWL